MHGWYAATVAISCPAGKQKTPNQNQQEVFSILMCHPAQVREGNEDDSEVVAASFVGMHMEREGSVVDADLAASTTLLSIEELEEGEMLRVGLGR